MGLIGQVLGMLFGGQRNVLKAPVLIVRENAEASGVREAETRAGALQQFASEFQREKPGMFDRIIDGINRIPRPALALGTLALFVAAMTDPVWFAGRMQGLALVPEPLWWLMGAIVGFYFGARSEAKGQAFTRSVAETLARTGTVVRNIDALRDLDAPPAPAASTVENAALADWRKGRG
jgi:hypothetical protein